jgi:hypothetical protein
MSDLPSGGLGNPNPTCYFERLIGSDLIDGDEVGPEEPHWGDEVRWGQRTSERP